MAKILSIVNFDESIEIDLIDDTALCVFAGESGERPLKGTGGLVTKTLNFKATAATKALARTAVNSFIASLRKALEWQENNLLSDSYFLKEAADGETAVRSFIYDWDARATVDGTAIDAYQTENITIYVSVALTLQNHREESEKDAPLFTGAAASSLGNSDKFFISNNTALSRINMEVGATTIINLLPSFPPTLTKLWIGIYPYVGSDFRHIWAADDISFGLETTTATVSGSYSTLVTDTNFTDTQMKVRAFFSVSNVYGGVNVNHAVGEFVVLLRYKVSASGTYLVRGGTGYTSGTIAYNEARLLDDSTQWRFVSLGVVKFPPNGLRQETATYFGIDNVALGFEAQRLSGSGHLYIDSVTLIPYEHYIHIDNLSITSSSDSRVVTHENWETEAFSEDVTNLGFGTIIEENNWGFPKIDNTYNVIVIAAERDGVQHIGDIIDMTDFDIYKAYEAYHA